jgi:hypothetical protein
LSLILWQSAHAQSKTGLRYPIKDRRVAAIQEPSKNPYDIRDTTLIKKTVVFDPITRQYKIVETIRGKLYRTPSYIDFDTYVKLQAKQDEADYFKKRAVFNLKKRRSHIAASPRYWFWHKR